MTTSSTSANPDKAYGHYARGLANNQVGRGEKPVWIATLNQGYAQTWNGLIDEVRIWSTVLTEDDIKLSMDGELLPVEPDGKTTTTWAELREDEAISL